MIKPRYGDPVPQFNGQEPDPQNEHARQYGQGGQQTDSRANLENPGGGLLRERAIEQRCHSQHNQQRERGKNYQQTEESHQVLRRRHLGIRFLRSQA